MINPTQFVSILRKLAKNQYWQTLYSTAKEINNINLFKNNHDYTNIQIEFMNNLSFYNSLYIDIALGEVGEIVLQDEIYEDAYYYHRNVERTKEKEKYNKMEKNLKNQDIQNIKETDQFVFKRSKK